MWVQAVQLCGPGLHSNIQYMYCLRTDTGQMVCGCLSSILDQVALTFMLGQDPKERSEGNV